MGDASATVPLDARPAASGGAVPGEAGDASGDLVDSGSRLGDERLSLEEVMSLSEIPSESIAATDWVLPGGITITEWLAANPDFDLETFTGVDAQPDASSGAEFLAAVDASVLVRFMQLCLFHLQDRSAWSASFGGLGQPAQNGLAYVWGSRDPKVRRRGVDGPGGQCAEWLHGVDCSGMVIYCANRIGVPLPTSSATGSLRNPDHWNSVVPPGANVVRVPLDSSGSTYAVGDVLLWKAHMGIVGPKTNDGKLTVAQSGGMDPPDKQWTCADNYGPKGGPRLVSYAGLVSSKLKEPSTVLRLVNERERAAVVLTGSAQRSATVRITEDGTELNVSSAQLAGGRRYEAEFATPSPSSQPSEGTTITLQVTIAAGSGASLTGWTGADCANAGTSSSLTFYRRLWPIECTAQIECPSGQIWDGTACAGTCPVDGTWFYEGRECPITCYWPETREPYPTTHYFMMLSRAGEQGGLVTMEHGQYGVPMTGTRTPLGWAVSDPDGALSYQIVQGATCDEIVVTDTRHWYPPGGQAAFSECEGACTYVAHRQ